MINNYKNHLINKDDTVTTALIQLNELASNAILFLVDDDLKLYGSLTDGDLRRGLIGGKTLQTRLKAFTQEKPKKILYDNYLIDEIIKYRKSGFKILPVVNNDDVIIDVINFNKLISYLPLNAFIVAGGKGHRLRPLTLNTPKPMLKVGEKPILEHNIDSLIKYGIKNINISIKYLGHQIEEYFGNGSDKGINISYTKEDLPLGTIGSITKCESFNDKDILLINSDLLTTINYEKLYLFFKENEADLVVAGVPYKVNVPYGVLESENNNVVSITEKPTYTYYSNAGIYIFKKKFIDLIPSNTHYNATDLIDKLLSLNLKVIKYEMTEYWLDIGKKNDFDKAQIDIKNLEYFK